MSDTITSADSDNMLPEQDASWPTRDVVDSVVNAIVNEDKNYLFEFTENLDSADIADLLDNLPSENRADFVMLLGDRFDYSILTDADQTVRDQIIAELPVEAVAEGVKDLEVDDAVYLIEDLDEEEQRAVLEALPILNRQELTKTLDYPEDSAGRLMSTNFIAIPQFWTVGQTIDFLREDDEDETLPDAFYEIYVIDPLYHLKGRVTLDTLLRAKRPIALSQIMREARYYADIDEDQEEVARHFERYDLVSAPVLDPDNRLVGVITIDDIVDVIHEESDEDIRLIVGLGDEELSDSILYTANSRFIWLLINLATAVLTSFVIGLFSASLEQMVALAILMPIVASMGGNAGTQTMTVGVRSLASRELTSTNAKRIIWREFMVGLLNGVAFAIIIGLIAAIWFGHDGWQLNYPLGLTIALAMIINMVSAGLFGILIPISLEKMNIDPAIASSVFVTTVTDVIGFLAFLGLASLWLL